MTANVVFHTNRIYQIDLCIRPLSYSVVIIKPLTIVTVILDPLTVLHPWWRYSCAFGLWTYEVWSWNIVFHFFHHHSFNSFVFDCICYFELKKCLVFILLSRLIIWLWFMTFAHCLSLILLFLFSLIPKALSFDLNVFKILRVFIL